MIIITDHPVKVYFAVMTDLLYIEEKKTLYIIYTLIY